jgi:DNA invertase Pin-like site-specific DNA recombinase
MPLAYSYIRFSTKDQLSGDSLRRQTELSERYCEEHDLTLIESYKDLGHSAFKGSHADTGALSEFLSLVKSGGIKAGSYLLIENFDRLSRERARTALSRLNDLIDAGIIVVTLADNKRYDESSDTMDIMYSLMIMGRAHEESQMKSQRLSASWSAKREKAQESNTPLTSRCPAWIELVEGKYQLIAERATVVRDIVDMTLAGMGKGTIARSLNRSGVKPFGKGKMWWDSYIQKILESPALYGTYQPKAGGVAVGEPLDDYYPAVIDKDMFYKMRAARSAPLSKGRKGKDFSNLLSGITTCSKCGSNMTYINKGTPPKGQKYLACTNRHAGLCESKYARYDQIEAITKLLLNRVDVSRIVEPQKVGGKKGDIEHAIEELDKRIANFTEVIGSGSVAVIDALKAAELEKQQLKEELEQLSIQEHSSSPLNQIQGVINDLYEKTGPELYQLREQLHRLLRGAVESFVIDADSKSVDIKLSNYEGINANLCDINGWTGSMSGVS